ncbi:N-formylglutamate amidohydrolase [Desulfosporosinus fructosivorans]
MSKPEDILVEFTRSRINEEAVNIEKVYFYKTDKRVNPKQEEPFWLAQGKLPVLVSAPHAVRHYRHKRIKMSDQFTGSIVYLLNQLTDCHAIAATKLYGGDPNFDDPCIYKERIAEICARQKVKFILDIHGAARDREFDVDLGTNGGKTLLENTRMLEVIERNLRNFGLSKISHDHFAASGPNTMANYIARELGIPAVQIEINKQYRVPAQNPQGFHRLLGALEASVKELAGE